MADSSKTPKLRFPGFTDAWEQRKLGTLCSLITKGTTPKDKSGGGEVNFVKVENIDTDNGEITSMSKISVEEHEGYLKRSRLEENDILFSIAGTLGRVSVVKSNILPANTNQALAIIRTNEGYIPYLTTVLKGPAVEDFIRRNPTIGAQPNLSLEQVNNLDISYPEYDEQVKIGDYYASLDNLITLHQRKFEKLKNIKKAMLQKMFPKNGEKIPEIRFPGFTGAWELRKLSDIVERITRKNQNIESTLPLTISAQYGMIDQNEFFDKRIASRDVSGYYLIKNGEFAYNKSTSNDAPWGAIKRLDRYENGVLSTLYIVFGIKKDVKVDSDYLVSYYETDCWHKGIQAIAAEGARNHGLLNIASADFFETKIPLPQDIEEQKKIGEYFSNLDNLITLHQRKFEKLKNIKKAMLQKMFPQNGEKIPEIRFPGFTGAWEQRKVSEIADRYDNLRVPVAANLRVPGDTPYYGANGIQDYVEGYTHDGEYILVAEDGASDLKNYPVNYVNGRIWVNNHAHVLQGKEEIASNRFLSYAISLANIESVLVGGGRAKLNADVMMNLDINIPSYVEQTQIAKCFSSLDKTITLHRRKLETLKTLKKGMLQQMFV